MRTLATVRALLCIALLVTPAFTSVHASIRIDGNQMLDSEANSEEASAQARVGDTLSRAGGPTRLVWALGQIAMPVGTSDSGGGNLRIVPGLAADIGTVVYNFFCAVQMTGDVNVSGALDAADIIRMVNFVFKSGAAPEPCDAAADVNCDGQVTAGDVIYMVNHVFKGFAPPCDVCSAIPTKWDCPQGNP